MADTRPPLSLAIICCNEEKNLRRCLESAEGLVSEIVIVDSGSEDRTLEIAEDYGAIVYHNPWPGFVVQKNIALSRCSWDWVISLDADEAISQELRRSLKGLFENGSPKKHGYWINRKTFYLGKWIDHAWYPDGCLRVVKRDSALFEGREPHAYLSVRGLTGKLDGDILHYSYTDLQDHLERTIVYGRIGAEALIHQGIRFKWHRLVFSPWMRFVKTLLLKSAWLDGWRGWIIAYSSLLACFTKYATLFESSLNEQQPTHRRGDEENE